MVQYDHNGSEHSKTNTLNLILQFSNHHFGLWDIVLLSVQALTCHEIKVKRITLSKKLSIDFPCLSYDERHTTPGLRRSFLNHFLPVNKQPYHYLQYPKSGVGLFVSSSLVIEGHQPHLFTKDIHLEAFEQTRYALNFVTQNSPPIQSSCTGTGKYLLPHHQLPHWHQPEPLGKPDLWKPY